MHDKEADTSERVAWSETGNLHTDDIKKAAIVMAWTDQNSDSLKREFGISSAGRKTEAGAVYHYSLSWSTDETPSQEHQREQALETLKRLGLLEHQYYMVAHNETEHSHVHIVANLTHPQSGKRHTPSFDKRELQSWALEYERDHTIYCKNRVENAQKRARGEHVKYQEKKQNYSDKVTRAYYAADNGQAFKNALAEEGLQLAKARRGNNFVVVDEKGDIQKLSRQLDIEERGKAKSEAIQNLLKNIDREQLPDAAELSKSIQDQVKQQEKPYDRDAEEVKQQKSLADAAEKHARSKAAETKNIKSDELKKENNDQLKKPPSMGNVDPYLKNLDKLREFEVFKAAERSKLEEELSQFYQRSQAENTLQQAKQDAENSNHFWGRLTGKHQQALEQVEAYENNLSSIKQREAEMREALELKLKKEEKNINQEPEEKLDSYVKEVKYYEAQFNAEAEQNPLQESSFLDDLKDEHKEALQSYIADEKNLSSEQSVSPDIEQDQGFER